MYIFQRRRIFWLLANIGKHMKAVALSAEMTFETRNLALQKFRNGQANVLVSTNLCSRALNLNVNMVINYDAPMKAGNEFDAKVFTYRVSRTGRFGTHGTAVTFNTDCKSSIKNILKRVHNVDMIEI